MDPLAVPRTRAYARDCLTYAGFAAAMLPLGLAGWASGWRPGRGWTIAVSAVPPVAAAVLAAAQESGPVRATPGKRRHGLAVAAAAGDQPVSFGRALARNLIKITVPWQLGHVVAIGAAGGWFDDRDPVTLWSTAALYPLLGTWAWFLLRRPGRTIHDRVAGTRVLTTAQ